MMNLFSAAGAIESSFLDIGIVGLILLVIFSLLVVSIKGYSLWYAARRDDKGWFIAILVINTFGLLELGYLLFVVKKWPNIYKGKEEKKIDGDKV